MTQLHHPFMIGPLEVRNRVLAAPLSGVSDLPFRQRSWAGGAGLVVSEMIASHEFCHSSNQSTQRALSLNCGPVMLQLAGREARWMGEAAKIAEAGGAEIIDINMGCPAKKVTGGASGSALMRDLDHAMSLVEATVAAVDVPVTLKMRLGWDDKSLNAPELARRAADAGVQMITVHGRTRCQFYDGEADWSAVHAVRDAIDVPLVVNGDITSIEKANEAIALSGADAVMVGRIAYGAPWSVGDLVHKSAGEKTQQEQDEFDLANYVHAHYQSMVAHYGERVGVRHARKHLNWYIERHLGCNILASTERRALMAAKSADEASGLIEQLFAGCDIQSTTNVSEAA